MSATASFGINLDELQSWFGIGVAGNFAGHLEQAGTITPPLNAKAASSLQAEPEVGLACEVRYAGDGIVEALIPFAFGACSKVSRRTSSDWMDRT